MDPDEIQRLYRLALENAVTDGVLEPEVQTRMTRELSIILEELRQSSRARQKFQVRDHRVANPFVQIRSFQLSQQERDEGYEKGLELCLVAERELKAAAGRLEQARAALSGAQPGSAERVERQASARREGGAHAYWQACRAYGETLISAYDDAVLTPSERSKIRRLRQRMETLQKELEQKTAG